MATTKTKEPVTIGGGIIALLVALGPLLQAFGVDLTEAQINTSLVFITAAVGLVTLIVRSKVTPVDKVPAPVTSEKQV